MGIGLLGLAILASAHAARVEVEVVDSGAVVYAAKFPLTGVDTLFGAREGEPGFGGAVTQRVGEATTTYEVVLRDRRHRRAKILVHPTLTARPDQQAQFWTQDGADAVRITILPD